MLTMKKLGIRGMSQLAKEVMPSGSNVGAVWSAASVDMSSDSVPRCRIYS